MSGRGRLAARALLAGMLVSAAVTLHADPNDPPTRVARLAYLDGGVSFRPAGAEDWAEPDINQPLTIGDQLWSDRDGRIELQLDGSNVRLGTDTAAGLLNLNDQSTQIQLSSGTLVVHVRQLADDESYEIDTPNVAFSILRPGTYRLTVDGSGGTTAVAVRAGQGEVVGGNGTGYTVRAGEDDRFSGTDQIDADSAALGPPGALEAWSADRDAQDDNSASAQYVSPDVVGYQSLDNQGDWSDTPDYGHVWFPTVEAGWAPYQVGRWAYVAPWGYTWIDARPWGFAPFHYGRWVYWQQRWGWVPVPPPAPRAVYVRPVYAPALVAWIGSGASVGWFPLAPREVYVPSYPVSRRYLDVVNASNTHVSTTIINNVYNTTIVNRVTVNNVTYANRQVPGAVMTASSQSLAGARPLRREGVVDARALANAPVRPFAPSVAPARAALQGGHGPASLRPPPVVQTRVIAARMAPAAAPVRGGGGSPAPAPAVRVLPPVRTLVSSRDFEAARAPAAPAANGAPAGRAAVHAGEIPPGPHAPSPASANSVLERQQSQEQQHLQAQQEAERQRLQQQQDQQHRHLAQPPADDARHAQLEQQQDAQRQAQAEAQAQLARRQQLDQQRSQQQADEQRAAQQQQQRQAELQAQQQAQQHAQQEQQARSQQPAQAQAELQRQQQAQSQRQQQERERQLEQQHQQQTQQLQQQQVRAREEMAERQQAAQRQQEQQHRASPAQPSQHPPPH